MDWMVIMVRDREERRRCYRRYYRRGGRKYRDIVDGDEWSG